MTPNRFILDASVTMLWLLEEDERADAVEQILREGEPVVPWLWRLEVTNTILSQE